MRKARRIGVSPTVPVTEEDFFVSDLGRRVKEIEKMGLWSEERAKFRREIADLLGSPFPLRRCGVRSRPARLRPGRRAPALDDESDWNTQGRVLY